METTRPGNGITKCKTDGMQICASLIRIGHQYNENFCTKSCEDSYRKQQKMFFRDLATQAIRYPALVVAQ